MVAGDAVTITVSGSAEPGELLYVDAEGEFGSCFYPNSYDALAGAGGVGVEGSFSRSFSYTLPASAGTVVLCGYLSKSTFETPAAKVQTSIVVEAATGTLSVTSTPSTTDINQPTTITVSGTTNAATHLFVVPQAGSILCKVGLISPGGAGALTPAEGVAVGSGAFYETYTFTPTSRYGGNELCAVLGTVGTYGSLTSIASASVTVTVRSEEEEEHEHAQAQKAQEAHEDAVQKELEVAEDAKEAAAYAARRAAALKKPVRQLKVHAVAHNSESSNAPGYTNLDVTTSQFAHVTVKLKRYGHVTYHIEWGEHTTAAAVVIPWSCHSPNGVYSYVVTARTDVGHTLTRKGRFSPVNSDRCHYLEKLEAEAREQENREVTEKYEAEARAERQRVENYEENCRKLGGSPVVLEVHGENRIFCRGPNGGIILVPH